MKRIPFTNEGFNKIKEEKKLLEKERIEAVINLKIARDMGDLSENAAYKVARSKLSSIDRRLRNVNSIIDKAYITKPLSHDVVEVGSFVTVENKTGISNFQIVNSYESDVSNGKISYFSPIGQALIGKRINDEVTIQIPSGSVTFKILKISV